MIDISIKAKDIEHLFKCLLVICISSLEKYIQTLWHFKLHYVSLLLNCRNFLCFLDTEPFSEIWFGNIPSHSLCYSLKYFKLSSCFSDNGLSCLFAVSGCSFSGSFRRSFLLTSLKQYIDILWVYILVDIPYVSILSSFLLLFYMFFQHNLFKNYGFNCHHLSGNDFEIKVAVHTSLKKIFFSSIPTEFQYNFYWNSFLFS